jgi:hypothetical protein
MKNYWALIVFAGALVAGARGAAALGPARALIMSAQVSSLSTAATSTPAEIPGKSGERSDNTAKNANGANAPDRKPASARLESGTVLVAELTKSLNAKKMEPGDKVTAKITQAVVVNGKVVLPLVAKLVGSLTETKARSKEDPESRLGIFFAKAMTKDGEEIPLEAVVQALARPRPSLVDKADPMLPPQIGPDNANNSMQPMGGSRSSATGNLRGAPVAPPTPNVSASLAPTLAAGTIPNPKGGPQENGMLSAGSRGIFGLQGLTLKFTGGAQIPVVASTQEDVKLENGTQIVLKVTRFRR